MITIVVSTKLILCLVFGVGFLVFSFSEDTGGYLPFPGPGQILGLLMMFGSACAALAFGLRRLIG